MRCISQDCPAKCTGTTIFGSLPIFAAFLSLSANAKEHILYVFGSISTKSTFAPQCNAALAVAANVLGVVHKISPKPSSNTRYAKCNAAVALQTAIACFVPQRSEEHT